MCLGYLCKDGKVEKRNFVFLSLIFLLVIVGLYNTEGRLDNPNVPMYYAFWFIYSLTILNDIDGWKETIIENRVFVMFFTKLWCNLKRISPKESTFILYCLLKSSHNVVWLKSSVLQVRYTFSASLSFPGSLHQGQPFS